MQLERTAYAKEGKIFDKHISSCNANNSYNDSNIFFNEEGNVTLIIAIVHRFNGLFENLRVDQLPIRGARIVFVRV